MPQQKPGRSEQVVGTPWALIRAIERRWGLLSVDLAATPQNTKAPKFLGPPLNSLEEPWHELAGGLLWLNPPFENLGAWAEKCRQEAALGARIIMLTPASVGAGWFVEQVCGRQAHDDYEIAHARVIVLAGRIAFQGCHVRHPKGHELAGQRRCVDPCEGCSAYPKDCMLTLWGLEEPGFEVWRWR